MVERYPDAFELALSAADVERIASAGKIASLIGIEGGVAIENSLAQLRAFFAFGRTLHDSHAQHDPGLGRRRHRHTQARRPFAVRRTRRQGDEPARHARRYFPCITGHDVGRAASFRGSADREPLECLRDLPVSRNVPDEILKLVKQNGGVIMVNFYSGFIVPESGKQMREACRVADQVSRSARACQGGSRRGTCRKRRNSRVDRTGMSWVTSIISSKSRASTTSASARISTGSRCGPWAWKTSPRIRASLTSLRRGYSEADVHKILAPTCCAFRQAGEVAKKLRATRRRGRRDQARETTRLTAGRGTGAHDLGCLPWCRGDLDQRHAARSNSALGPRAFDAVRC